MKQRLQKAGYLLFILILVFEAACCRWVTLEPLLPAPKNSENDIVRPDVPMVSSSSYGFSRRRTREVLSPLGITMIQFDGDIVTTPGTYGNEVTGNNPRSLFKNAATTPITVDSFSIAETELTYEKWYEVYTWATDDARGDEKYTFQYPGREGSNGVDGAPPTEGCSEPVTYIYWYDALLWCNAASEYEGLMPVYWYTGTQPEQISDRSLVMRSAALQEKSMLPVIMA